ncbi:MAG: hypothetical protein KGO22_15610 [Gammaproteobacteria bacterium]|nr:hypothetical protein [Gammaproteobacteria bacterium]
MRRTDARLAAGLLPLLLAVPPLQRMLEASMTAQMLVQIPLLAIAGMLLGNSLPERVASRIEPWNRRGATGLIVVTLASACWMLPLSLDAAAVSPAADLAKFVTVPLLIGLPLAASWPCMSFVLRGVLLFEALATLFRMGWLYLISPVRLCNSYGLSDQQRLGEWLLAGGAALLLCIAWRLLWGRPKAAAGAVGSPGRRAGPHA